MYHTRFFLTILLSLTLISCSVPVVSPTAVPTFQIKLPSIKLQIKNSVGESIDVFAELAQTSQDQERGLMYRTTLGEQQGMLFLFKNISYQAFWMKNTLIPLDMLFIDETKKIVTIKEAEPCKADPCDVYDSDKPVKYVLEVQQGFSRKHNIQIGNEVLFND